MTTRDSSTPAPPSAPGFERVARVSEIPEGSLLSVQRGRERVCLYHQAGQVGAIADLCTHQAFPMSEGTLESDGTIECAWHGARFDCRTGKVRQGPAAEPLIVYEVRVENGEIWVGPPR